MYTVTDSSWCSVLVVTVLLPVLEEWTFSNTTAVYICERSGALPRLRGSHGLSDAMWRLVTDCEFRGGTGAKKRAGAGRQLCAHAQATSNACYAEVVYGSCIRRFGAVVDIGCILHWPISTWGWSVMAGGSRGGAYVPGGWRSEEPTASTHTARPSHYLWLSTESGWKGQITFQQGCSMTLGRGLSSD